MFKKLLMAITLLASVHGFAGQDGNGGFGINCGGKLEILDLYEAQNRYHYTIDLGPASMSVDQKVEKMLKRLERINKVAADRYREQYANLWDRAEILNGQKLIKNNDTIAGSEVSFALDVGVALVPEGCNIIPLARNIDDDSVTKNIYFIGKYWNQLNNNTKAALILHELIYFDSISGKLSYSGLGFIVGDSSPVRKLIGLLASRDVEKLEYKKLLKQVLIKDENFQCTYNYTSCLRTNLLTVAINGFQYGTLILDPRVFTMSSDGSYVKTATGENHNSYYRVSAQRQFLGKQVRTVLLDGKTEFLDKDTPNRFTFFSRNADDEMLHYSFLNGSLDFAAKNKKGITFGGTFYGVTIVTLWGPNKIKEIINMQNAEINLPLFGKLKADRATFDEKGSIVTFSTEDFALDRNTPIIFEQFEKYRNLSVRYYYNENSTIKEIHIDRIMLKKDNPYVKSPYSNLIALRQATLDPNLKIKCAQLERPQGLKVKVNGRWIKLQLEQTVEFDSSGKPTGLNCKIPDPSQTSN